MSETKTERVMRSPDELRAIAERLSATITVITDGGEVKRRANKKEKDFLYSLFLGALFSLNMGSNRSDIALERAVLDTTELIASTMSMSILQSGERLQSYISIFCPLKAFIDGWTRRIVD